MKNGAAAEDVWFCGSPLHYRNKRKNDLNKILNWIKQGEENEEKRECHCF